VGEAVAVRRSEMETPLFRRLPANKDNKHCATVQSGEHNCFYVLFEY
jgi:hypothetical protein